jgi:hypothetical protein
MYSALGLLQGELNSNPAMRKSAEVRKRAHQLLKNHGQTSITSQSTKNIPQCSANSLHLHPVSIGCGSRPGQMVRVGILLCTVLYIVLKTTSTSRMKQISSITNPAKHVVRLWQCSITTQVAYWDGSHRDNLAKVSRDFFGAQETILWFRYASKGSRW